MLREIFFPLLVCIGAFVGLQILEGQRDIARAERDAALFEASGLREAVRISGEMLAERDSIDQRNTGELTYARTENERLRRAIGDGAGRLLVRTACPATRSVPATASTARVVDAGAAELAADARPDYFTLRDELALSRQMILGLQQYALGVCLRTPENQGTTFSNLKKRSTQ